MSGRFSLFVCLVTFVVLFSSCSDDEADANDSIQGDWEVSKALFIKGDERTEDDNTGYMNFFSETVEYEFMVGDSLYSGSEDWELMKEMVNSGFHKVPKYTLSIGDDLVYDVLFGDGTDDSADDAREMTLTQDEGLTDEYMVLSLEKK